MTEQTTPQDLQSKDYRARLREARLAAGASLAAVGEALGKTLQFASEVEKGRSHYTVPQLIAACDVLRLHSTWVLYGVGPMFKGGPKPTKSSGRPAARG